MKQHYFATAFVLLGLVFSTGAAATGLDMKALDTRQKAAYGIGFNMGKSLAQDGLKDLDLSALRQGFEDAMNNKASQLDDLELRAAFGELQQEAQKRLAALNEENIKAGKKFLEDNGKRKGVVTTASGLQYEVVKKAEGARPKATDVVSVHYEGKLIDGKVFDSSIARGEPIELPLSGVIKGWTEGLQLMQVGEKYRLFIPDDLAYGEQSPSADIPPGSVLVFEVELLDIKAPQ